MHSHHLGERGVHERVSCTDAREPMACWDEHQRTFTPVTMRIFMKCLESNTYMIEPKQIRPENHGRSNGLGRGR